MSRTVSSGLKVKSRSMSKLNNVFSDYPVQAKRDLEYLRKLILDVAKKTSGVGQIEECLKWGELSFVTSETKSGSTIRIDWKKKDPERVHLYFHCQTKLIPIFKELYPNDFDFGGNRSISFRLGEKIPERKITNCIKIALTYHLKNYKDFFK